MFLIILNFQFKDVCINLSFTRILDKIITIKVFWKSKNGTVLWRNFKTFSIVFSTNVPESDKYSLCDFTFNVNLNEQLQNGIS